MDEPGRWKQGGRTGSQCARTTTCATVETSPPARWPFIWTPGDCTLSGSPVEPVALQSSERRSGSRWIPEPPNEEMVPDGGVALIIPALDEEAAIPAVLRAVPPGLVDDLVVVDNGSTDHTAAVARAAGARVVPEPRRGYGAACWAGVVALAPEIAVVAFLDGDGSQDPGELPRLLAPLRAGSADLVLGARMF